MIGRLVLGKYRVVRKIGEGGVGRIYLVEHTDLPDTVAALKVLPREAIATSSLERERFKQEALAAAKVGSHRVVRPLDFGELDDGTPYILMEYVAGCSLIEELSRGPMDIVDAVQVALRIADTMAIAHAKSIIHRDLSPQNIMVAVGGSVKIIDFGISKVQSDVAGIA